MMCSPRLLCDPLLMRGTGTSTTAPICSASHPCECVFDPTSNVLGARYYCTACIPHTLRNERQSRCRVPRKELRWSCTRGNSRTRSDARNHIHARRRILANLQILYAVGISPKPYYFAQDQCSTLCFALCADLTQVNSYNIIHRRLFTRRTNRSPDVVVFPSSSGGGTCGEFFQGMPSLTITPRQVAHA